MTEPTSSVRSVTVGLIGGIASGKSTVAGILEEHGFVRVDADRIALEVVEEPEVRAAIVERFGQGILGEDGSLDRRALADVVFSDSDARRDLEALTHPRVRHRIEAALAEARGAGRPTLLDVPLLVEGGLIERCDEILFVEAPLEVRRRRAAARGWSDAELARRESAQAPLLVKRSRATATIENSGSLAQTRAQLEAFLSGLADAHD